MKNEALFWHGMYAETFNENNRLRKELLALKSKTINLGKCLNEW